MSFSCFKNFAYQVAIQKIFNKLILPNEFFENENFELPDINGNKSYEALSDNDKEQFVWFGGGNVINNNVGPIISESDKGYGFPSFVTGKQAIAMQSTSFIQQTLHLNIGTYVFSTYFIGRYGTQNNPIEVSINGTIITTIDQVANTWTLFTHTFNILEAGDKTSRLEGTSQGGITTGIDLVALSRKTFPYIPIPNDTFISNTETEQGAEGYEASDSGSIDTRRIAYNALNNNNLRWHSKHGYDDGIYTKSRRCIETIVSVESIFGEYIQVKLPLPII
jgi:hypothetical protein